MRPMLWNQTAISLFTQVLLKSKNLSLFTQKNQYGPFKVIRWKYIHAYTYIACCLVSQTSEINLNSPVLISTGNDNTKKWRYSNLQKRYLNQQGRLDRKVFGKKYFSINACFPLSPSNLAQQLDHWDLFFSSTSNKQCSQYVLRLVWIPVNSTAFSLRQVVTIPRSTTALTTPRRRQERLVLQASASAKGTSVNQFY